MDQQIKAKYKLAQQEVRAILKDFGYRKAGRPFRRELADANVLVQLSRVPIYEKPEELAWYVTGSVRYKLLDPIYRDGDEPEFQIMKCDHYLADDLCRRPDQDPKVQVFWVITAETDMAAHMAEVKAVFIANLRALHEEISQERYVQSRVEYLDVKDPSLVGILKTVVVARLLGLTDAHEKAMILLDSHYQRYEPYVKYTLRRTEEYVKQRSLHDGVQGESSPD
jgi:hypothetical protein